MEFLSFSYMQNALMVSMVVGVGCAYLSSYIILKRIVFVSIVLAQLAILGLSVSLFFQLATLPRIVLSFIFTLAGVIYMTWPPYSKKLSPDSVLGMGYAGFYAIGLLVLSKTTQGLEEIHHLMSGNILAIAPGEIHILMSIVLVIGIIHAIFYRKFVFTSFDPEYAESCGVKTKLWEFIFYLCLGLIITASIHLVGLNYVFSCLVFPGSFAFLLVNSIAPVQIVSTIFATVTAFAGVWFSYTYDFPTVESIIAVQAVLFTLLLVTRSLLLPLFFKGDKR